MAKHKKLLVSIIIVLVLVLAIIFTYFILQKPPAATKDPEDNRVLVNAVKVTSGNYTPYIEALGKIEPAEQVALMAEASGKVIKINQNFVPGGFIKKGELILEIDPANYKIALAQAKARYSKADAAYQQALGRSTQAKEELRVYEKNTGKKIKNSYLALRKPELDQAKSDIEAAKVELSKAELDLERTKVIAPFNLIVKDRSINYGSFVSAGVALANLVNTDRYWVNASVSIKNMSYIDFTTKTEAVLETNNQEGSREVSFFKLLNYLDDSARFMGLLFVIKDPLLLNRNNSKSSNINNQNSLNKPKVFLDDYVKVTIKGKELKNVFRIPLFTLKNDNIVWLAENNNLVFKKVTVVYQDNNYAYVVGLNENDLIIDSDVSLVTNNTPIKIINVH